MSYQTERDQFIMAVAKAGLPVTVAQALLRYASTLQRLAVAACNGDWPCDNGARKVVPCPKCEGGFVPGVIKGSTYLPKGIKACPDCRTAAAVQVILAGSGLIPKFGGDPRGAVLRLYPADTLHDDIETGRARGIYVPARER